MAPKKFIKNFYLLAVLIVFATTISCGVKKSDQKVIRIRWMVDEAPHRYATIRRFEQQNPGIKIDFYQAGNFDKLLTMIASDDAPEVFAVYSISAGRELAKRGAVLDLRPYLSDINVSVDDFWPALKDYMFINEGLYGLPENAGVDIFYYNKKLFDFNGVPYPPADWSYQTFLSSAKKVTGTIDGVKNYGIPDYPFWRIFFQNDAAMFNDTLDKFTINSPAGKEAMQIYYNLLFKENCLPSASERASMEEGKSMTENPFTMGTYGMIFSGHWMTGNFRNIKDFEWDIQRPPRIKNNRAPFASKVYMIPKSIKKERFDATLKFIAYLMTDNNMKFIAERADGLPSRISSSKKPFVLFNENYPKEKNNQIYLDAMETAYIEYPYSPYINDFAVNVEVGNIIQLMKISEGKLTAQETIDQMQKLAQSYIVR